MAKNFRTLESKMSKTAMRCAEEIANKLETEMALDQLRMALQMTQEQIAALLNVRQSAVSKMERRTDMYISTLQNMIEAMGGELEILAVFPQGKVAINQFGKPKEEKQLAGTGHS
jgi:predicted XRE-type DNA-binding protein